MASKNQGRLQRGYMGHHEGDTLNTLPKYNYATGFGWKSHKRHQSGNAFGSYSIIRKSGGGRKTRLGSGGA